MRHCWCMKRDAHTSHNLLNRVLQREGGDAEAGIGNYETTRAMLGQKIAFAAFREAAEGSGCSLL